MDPAIVTPKANGRPPHAPTAATRGLVSMAVLMGLTQDQIAAGAGIDRKTLAKHYGDELHRSFLKIGATLTQTGLQMAMGGMGENADWTKGNPGMVQYFLSRRFGFNDPVQRHVVANYDLEKLDVEELEALDRLLSRAAPSSNGPGDTGT